MWCDIDCRDVLYENNIVERNRGWYLSRDLVPAVIRNNIVRHNGGGGTEDWFWGDDILIAASQDVEVYANVLTVSAGGCGDRAGGPEPSDRGQGDKTGREIQDANNNGSRQ